VLLKEAGVRVALLDAGRVASGVTGYTTAKVTSLHGLIYADLAETFGDDAARTYGEANQAALERVARFVAERNIDCDFARRPAYTYTEDPEGVGDIEAEVTAAQRAGLPARFTTETDLPFEVQGAVCFDHQALFHPRKYCINLAASIPGEGSYVFESTRALDVEQDSACTVRTERGDIRADHVVMATLLPFLDRGGFFAKCHPSRSYALAVRVEEEATQGMYLSAGSPTRSVRPHMSEDQTLLIISGEGHKTGQDQDTTRRYAALEDWTRSRYSVRSVDYRWSAQDYIPVDRIPYIGPLTRRSERLYVATGFKKWGMTNGTAAAMIISDAILGHQNPWASLFDANRVEVSASAKEFVKENLNVAKRFVGDRLKSLVVPSIDELGPGEGKVVRAGGEVVAAYRDDDGVVHAVSPICTHMGCHVTFNTAERSWDCPCHGSRFDYDGRVIQGPALKDLEAKDLGTRS
jgi:glycine/D-amino acid oxidase-like deaminating enzyme/nitrite reductase/ring-hydroxylating ferredoxin subunit